MSNRSGASEGPDPEVGSASSVAVDHLPQIDALRGYAMLAVFAFHTLLYCDFLPGTLRGVMLMGGRGVMLFYVISAVTLVRSYKRRQELGPVAFYFRRFFRIAPLFYFACGVYWLWCGTGPRNFAPAGIDAGTVLANVLFVSAWVPDAINSLVPGAWSVANEMVFYLLFPLLLHWAGTVRRAIWVLVGALCLNMLAIRFQTSIWHWLGGAEAFPGDGGNIYFYFWPVAQFPVFALGIVLGLLMEEGKSAANSLSWLFLLCGGVLAFAGIRSMPSHFVYAMGFAAIIWAATQRPIWFFTHPWIVMWGKISFSCYLLHLLVLDAVAYFCGLRKWSTTEHFTNFLVGEGIITLPTHWLPRYVVFSVLAGLVLWIVASVTYKWIEVPGVNLGRSLIRRCKG